MFILQRKCLQQTTAKIFALFERPALRSAGVGCVSSGSVPRACEGKTTERNQGGVKRERRRGRIFHGGTFDSLYEHIFSLPSL